MWAISERQGCCIWRSRARHMRSLRMWIFRERGQPPVSTSFWPRRICSGGSGRSGRTGSSQAPKCRTGRYWQRQGAFRRRVRRLGGRRDARTGLRRTGADRGRVRSLACSSRPRGCHRLRGCIPRRRSSTEPAVGQQSTNPDLSRNAGDPCEANCRRTAHDLPAESGAAYAPTLDRRDCRNS